MANLFALAFQGPVVSLRSCSTTCIYVPCKQYAARPATEVPVRRSCQKVFDKRVEVLEGLLDTEGSERPSGASH